MIGANGFGSMGGLGNKRRWGVRSGIAANSLRQCHSVNLVWVGKYQCEKLFQFLRLGRDITAGGDITATGGIFGANIGTKDTALTDANYSTVWSSINYLSTQIGTGGSGGSYDDTALTYAMWGADGISVANNLLSLGVVFNAVNGGLATVGLASFLVAIENGLLFRAMSVM